MGSRKSLSESLSDSIVCVCVFFFFNSVDISASPKEEYFFLFVKFFNESEFYLF